ncbi:hypothetical protein WIW50_04830 [Flavobacteriaceae bacterium 3-367]
MKRIQPDFSNNLGIGAFAFLSIFEFCGLLEYLARNVFIISKVDSKIVLWLPEIISLIAFVILIVWTVNKYNKLIEIETRKVLIKAIGLFFGIILLEFLITYLGGDYFIDNYPEEFDLYIDGGKGNYELLGYIALIPILKYVFLGVLLLTKNSSQQRV